MNSVRDDFFDAAGLKDELASALRVRGIALNAEPQVDLASGRLVGAEMLIGWNRVERLAPEPAQFGPLVQERGLLFPIGAWMLREAVAATAEIRLIRPSFRMWINVSAEELRDRAWLQAVLGYGNALRGVGIEITERVAMHDLEHTLRTLNVLRPAGLSVTLDDFGAGHCSPESLKRLRVDVVKLDRDLVAALPHGRRERDIVSATLCMARGLGFDVVAEGIETPEQLRTLRDEGCRYGQGSYLERPVAIAELRRAIRDGALVS
ncbi:MAG TPA: EAL domain-containing protein [Candidatus Elarobacter sp.]|jgi:EAL domain-containing protein (putative c-di-GMP-specific phosphodiesterase class I)